MKRMILGVLVFVVASAGAADWPQYGGMNRDNISGETGLADSWPEQGPAVLWETAVHDGYSGAAIRDGKAYMIDRREQESLLRCIDMDSGKDLWVVAIDDPGEMKGAKYEGTRGTPTITDNFAYLVTGYGTLACIDLELKMVRWKHHLLTDYEMELAQFGIAQSPFVAGNMVFVSVNSKDVGVAAYDRKTGTRLWVSKNLGMHAYASPNVVTVCGQEMVIALGSCEKAPRPSRRKKKKEENPKPKKEPAPGHVVGLSLKDGTILWDYTGWRCHAAISYPVSLPGNRFFITGGYNAGSAMIQIEKNGDEFVVNELFKSDEVGAQIHQSIRVGDYLYVGSTSNRRKDGLASFSLDGQLLWRTKDIDGAPLFERSPFILADGKLIALDAKSGTLYLLKADPLQYTEVSKAVLLKKGDMSWAPMALSDGKLLIRDWNVMKCINLK